jgi:predicted nucleic acid-binding Zn ribbon protein
MTCPVCSRPLAGRQTVCSPRCRLKRWRGQRASRRARLLELARELVKLLEEP